jgi:crotonobetainyl-CoA:carnitine CoA-transferase CaiB-like acyl-CoA transferase
LSDLELEAGRHARGGPLDGLRILDTTQYVSGPYCSMLLADLGADVIKIERPETGDVYRVQGPQFIRNESVTFLALNRNKRSMTANLHTPEGRERVLQLACEADVFLENSSPGTMERLGLGYEEMRSANPAIIYCSLSGYGQTGPRSEEGGYDLMLQAEGGLMSVTGEPGGPPVKVGVPVLDYGAALYAAVGILAAYAHRLRTGEGQRVDASLLDTAVGWLTVLAASYWATGLVPDRLGSRSQLFAPYQAFEAKDGWITVIGTGGKDGWQALCGALELPELAKDPRFSSNASRVANLDELEPILSARLREADTASWVRRLRSAGLPAAPIQRIDAVLEDPQVRAREMVVDVEHPRGGTYTAIGTPVKLSATPASVRRGPPRLGQHQGETFAVRDHPEGSNSGGK